MRQYHPGADQKTVQSDHPMQVGAARVGVPANPSVPIPKLERRGGEAKPTQPAVLRAHQIAQLTADQWARSAGVPPFHQAIDNRVGPG